MQRTTNKFLDQNTTKASSDSDIIPRGKPNCVHDIVWNADCFMSIENEHKQCNNVISLKLLIEMTLNTDTN